VSSPRLTTVIGVVALGFLGSIVLFAQGNAAAAAIKNPVAATPQSIAAGQEAYRKMHGTTGPRTAQSSTTSRTVFRPIST
jgi:hypothetical protein